MGKIKKILENELAGGTQTTDVYPVTSTKAVYDENNKRLDEILGASQAKVTELEEDDLRLGLFIDGVNSQLSLTAEDYNINYHSFNTAGVSGITFTLNCNKNLGFGFWLSGKKNRRNNGKNRQQTI